MRCASRAGSSVRTIWRSGRCPACSRSMPKATRARSNYCTGRCNKTPHALAMALAAWAHIQGVVYHFTDDPEQERARSLDLARRARALAGDATVLAVLGNALTLLGDLDAADIVIRKALSLDGGSAWAWSRSGWIDAYRGDAESAVDRFKIALDLAPQELARLQQPSRHRLRAFRGRQLCRSRPLAAACARRASVRQLGASNVVSGLFACRR